MGMSKAEEEEQARLERARAAGLFRYMLIREAADPALSSRQRGAMVRAIAAREHAGPSGEPVRVTRWTLDVWIRAWRTGGFTALAPPARQVTPRTDAAALDLAAGLKRGKPARTAAQVARILRAACGWSPSVRTLQRHFERLELNTRPDGTGQATFGRFEAAARTSCGPATRCTAPRSPAARRTCSRSSMIIVRHEAPRYVPGLAGTDSEGQAGRVLRQRPAYSYSTRICRHDLPPLRVHPG